MNTFLHILINFSFGLLLGLSLANTLWFALAGGLIDIGTYIYVYKSVNPWPKYLSLLENLN